MIKTKDIVKLGFEYDKDASETAGGRVFIKEDCSIGLDKYNILRIHKKTEGIYERVFEDRVDDLIELTVKLSQWQAL